MAISPKLMKALLSLDSYNRGYNQGVIYEGDVVGNYEVLKDSFSLGYLDPQADPLVRKDVDAGFYGIAYQHVETDPQSPNYQDTIISYRGTDDAPTLNSLFDGNAWSDIWNGWFAGGGDTDAKQAEMAFDFYSAGAEVRV